jgi:prophage DNA circulation protein
MKHYLGICLVLITLAALTLLVINRCTDAASRAVGQVRDAFAAVLQVQPKIVVNERVVQTQTAPIAELAVVTKEEQVTLGFNEHEEILSYSIPLTAKKLTVEGTYRLKAGFDLRQPFSVVIDPATHQVHATLPEAKILSVEQVGDLTYQGEDSLLNRLTDTERAQTVNDLYKAARQAAENSTLKREATDQVTQRLQELLAHDGQKLDLQWKSNPSNPSTVLP